MKQALLAKARELGFDDCRVTTADAPQSLARFRAWLDQGRDGHMGYLRRGADKRANLDLVLPGARSVVTLACSYEHKIDKASPTQGLVARYAHHMDYHDILAPRLKTLADFINEQAGPETRSLWYVDTGPILERDLAQRAGLGFVGKHTSLISRRLGNWFLIAEIITTAQLKPDAPEHNHCGSCARCIIACPTRAIIAPFELDARLCISYLTIELKGSIPLELRPLLGNRIFGCDDCLEACPWNRFAREGGIMKNHLRRDLATPDLLELLLLDEAGFRKRFEGTPMMRSRRRGLLRNVCVALGNTGGRKALPALARAAQDPEPLIAEHASWALRQIVLRVQPGVPGAAELSSSW